LPLAARAQRSGVPVVGYLSGNVPGSDPAKSDFLKGLSQAGFVDGRNVVIEYRYASNAFARLPELASDLVRRRVDVLAASAGNAVALAAKAATPTIPIVFSTGADPVALGLVASLNRPGANLTGASFLTTDIATKMFEVLNELVPHAAMATLFNPANPLAEGQARELQEAARANGVELDVLAAGDGQDIDVAFATLIQRRTGALIVLGDALFNDHARQLVALTLRHGIPAVFQNRGIVEAGGLVSYGGHLEEASRIAGFYAGRVLKGEKIADLPVQQVTRFELVINLTTAKVFGLTIPEKLLATADEVIQ
jgi:putative ABC transport system substrate-binding protein